MERKVFAESGAIQRAGDIADYKTDPELKEPENTTKPEDYDTDEEQFVRLVETLSPLLISHSVSVKIVDDSGFNIAACTRWRKDSFELELNLAFHDVHDWTENWEVIIHELAHHKVQSNDHLCREFYDSRRLRQRSRSFIRTGVETIPSRRRRTNRNNRRRCPTRGRKSPTAT